MAKFNHRHFQQIQLARRRQAAVTGNDAVGAVDEDGLCPAELDDAGGQFGDLRLGMRARIAGEISVSILRYSTRSCSVIGMQNPPRGRVIKGGGNSVQVVTGVVTGNR